MKLFPRPLCGKKIRIFVIRLSFRNLEISAKPGMVDTACADSLFSFSSY